MFFRHLFLYLPLQDYKVNVYQTAYRDPIPIQARWAQPNSCIQI